jgi:hypothetical protein
MMTHTEIIELIQAHKDGKKLEYSYIVANAKRFATAWRDVDPNLSLPELLTAMSNGRRWRIKIKKEPIVRWLVISNTSGATIGVFRNLDTAVECANYIPTTSKIIKMEEVEEDNG